MTSIDELFKGVGSKRKLEPLRDPNQIYKSARLNGHSSSSSSRHAQVEDEPPTEDDDTEAGPALPPDDEDEEGDYGPSLPPDDNGDDDEGRFFGGGVSAAQNEILDYVDGQDGALPQDKIDVHWLRKTALNFEKRISKNAELRAKYEADPSKFIQSEAELDADVKALSILSEHPDLYSEFAKLGCVASLVGLLAHENSDIAIDALEILNELTDDEVAAEEADWGALVDAALEADLLGLVVSNLERLDEKEEVDRNGVYHALNVVENLCSRIATAEVVGKQDMLLKWLLGRIQTKENPVGQNKQYAAEILAILVQSSKKNRRKLAQIDAVDMMLQLVAAYRKRNPEKGGEEEEYMENLFEALTCIVDEEDGKTKFIEAEGVELCLIMLKEGKMSKVASLRLLDHAVGGPTGAHVCAKLVEAGGLKNIFTLFMKKSDDSETAEHLVGIFASLLRLLPAGSGERIRTLAKFVEKDYEKTVKLVKLRREYAARLDKENEAIQAQQALLSVDKREQMADEWFSRKLDAGLFSLQTIDVVLAWLVAEDAGAQTKIMALLAERDETLRVIKQTIQEQLEGMDADDDEGKDTRDMLATLVKFLQ
ncbi:Catenin-beta-like protein [Pseudomassariella vexata]|uniref:Catenin-beta-like protein n=1 Tax=Pseudomassariella vexata TaxID=1141098 RepID=A0A1Y2D6S2_9PEZI|nr:Catenin-beta-like protein [Pseudomassariella vexata]ORY54982.1 Catenin-beta-like protein [Pseudomassariella vexata]